MEPMTIRKLIEGILNGQTRIPAFQREFVWEPERVALFIDSIYKGYPFGSLLFCAAGGSARLPALRLSGVGEDEPPVCGEREAGEREARGKQLRYGVSVEWRHTRARWRLLAER